MKLEDLDKYNSPLVGFDGRIVVPKGMIKLPIQTGDEVVEVSFVTVDVYSPYTAILARPWLHAMRLINVTSKGQIPD